MPDPIRVKVLHEHTGDSNGGPCFEWDGVVGLFIHPTEMRTEHRDSIGRRTRGTGERWAHVRCNTPGCEFDAIFALADIERLVENADA